MAFPRLCALAEVLWTPLDRREPYRPFEDRPRRHLERLDALGAARSPAPRATPEDGRPSGLPGGRVPPTI
ncbi:MAG: hypothetical protein OXM87_03465 [Truepera sp.]|nr:hypothetical protein [Truepera sp.]